MLMMRSDQRQITGLERLCEHLPDNLVGLEIGSYAGESASRFLASGKFTKLYCVDPWWLDEAGNFTEAELLFDKTASKDSRIIKCRGVLADFRLLLPSVDFVYIDGDHKEQAVLRDISQVMLFLKPGGTLAGHDFGGVVQNSIELFFGKDYITFEDSSWLVSPEALTRASGHPY